MTVTGKLTCTGLCVELGSSPYYVKCPSGSVGSGPILEMGILNLSEVNSLDSRRNLTGEQQSFLPRVSTPKAHAQDYKAGGSPSCRQKLKLESSIPNIGDDRPRAEEHHLQCLLFQMTVEELLAVSSEPAENMRWWFWTPPNTLPFLCVQMMPDRDFPGGQTRTSMQGVWFDPPVRELRSHATWHKH